MALNGARRLPDYEADLVAKVLVRAGRQAAVPKRVVAAHRLILDLQEAVFPVKASDLPTWLELRAARELGNFGAH